jgi:hypothetical protein
MREKSGLAYRDHVKCIPSSAYPHILFNVSERDIDEVVEQRDGHSVGLLRADARNGEAVC